MLMPIMNFMTRFYHNYSIFCRLISVLFSRSAIFLKLAFFSLLIFAASCEENPTKIGWDLLPASDFIKVKSTDKFNIDAYTMLIDSAVTNNRTYSYLGKLHDPYFGDTKNDFVGQLRLAKPWPGGGPFEVDSVMLYISIVGAKGKLDTTVVHRIQLFEINEMLYTTTKYYSDRDPNAGMDIGTFPLAIIKKDTIQDIAVKLPKSFGEYLMRDTTRLTQDDDTKDFRKFFNGLYVTMPDDSDPVLLAIDLTSTNFLINVTYHNYKTAGLTYSFIINENSIRYNRYNHNFLAADADKRIQHINDGVKDSMVYLQAFSGVFPRIRIDSLAYYKSHFMPLSVNKARMTFSVLLDGNTFTTTTVPPLILMKYTKADTVQYVVPDYQVSSSFFDGTFNVTKKTYSFNLAAFSQEYMKGNIAEPYVDMYFQEGEYENVILKANNSLSPVKFEFSYTRF
jgi:hypothetical protein